MEDLLRLLLTLIYNSDHGCFSSSFGYLSYSSRRKFSELRIFHFYPLVGLSRVISVTSMICLKQKINHKVGERYKYLHCYRGVDLPLHLQVIKFKKIKGVLIFLL
jgi:hypothetical protein